MISNHPPNQPIIPLISISFVILFLELLLIRLIGTEVRIFAYLSNLILLAIFIGSGLGMFIKKKLSLSISSFLIVILLICLQFKIFNHITDYLSPLSQSFIWFQSSWNSFSRIVFGLFLTIVLFLIVMAIFIPLGQFIGSYFFSQKKIILYYSLNVLFSLVGIWIFNLLSIVNFSPYLSIAIAQLILILFTKNKDFNLTSFSVISTIILVAIPLFSPQQTFWSPYQKLTLAKLSPQAYQPSGYQLKVNNVGYMGLLDLSENYQNSLSQEIKKITSPENFDIHFSNQYDLPYQIKPNANRVLIIGSGGGNDAAGAIRANIPAIDAVEIDPRIVALGQKYHPEKPYSHPSVNITIDDGRSFIKKTKNQYDLVIMSLADSHTLNSPLNNIQLDNYLYTQESIDEIKSILSPQGILLISFDVRRPWIGSKIQHNLTESFGHAPRVFSLQKDLPIFGWGGVIFVQDIASGQITNSLSSNKDLKEFIDQRKLSYERPVKPMTDDWPYLYLDQPRIPIIHIVISALILIILLVIMGNFPLSGKFRWDSFFLGSGFLLFEFQNISKTSLLYGNTWITNVFTISAILILILLANLISAKIKLSHKLSYLLLFLSFIMEIILPLSFFNTFSAAAKYLYLPFLLNLPLFFSGIIFVTLLYQAKQKKSFFASNLIGSALGGVLGFFSYAFGLKSLLFISLLMYFLSFTKVKSTT